jgi:hypothetical protein
MNRIQISLRIFNVYAYVYAFILYVKIQKIGLKQVPGPANF